MNYRVWVGTIFITLYLFSNFDPSYSNKSVKNFAEYLFKEKDYVRAIGEYQRLSFSAKDEHSLVFYQFKVGECYRRLNNFDRAKEIYDDLMSKCVGDCELEKRLIISSSKCNINSGALKYARIKLMKFEKSKEHSDSISYLIGVSYLKERKWKEAEEEFSKIMSPKLIEHTTEMLREVSGQHFKSSKVAVLLSTFIPGAGQIYASRPLKGIISFSLNLSFAYLTYKAAKEDRGMDAFLIVYFGLQRFYFGNIEQARKYPLEHNRKILDNIQVE